MKAYLTFDDLTAREEKLRDKMKDWINHIDDDEEDSKSEDEEQSSKQSEVGSDSQSGSEKSNKETPNHSKEEYEDNS